MEELQAILASAMQADEEREHQRAIETLMRLRDAVETELFRQSRKAEALEAYLS